jgi:hypothetical protein
MMSVELALIVLSSLAALAWGPGHHIEFAQRVHRRRRELLPSRAAKLIGEQHHAYLYGNIAADLINFKAFGGHYNHCHRWTIVDDMQEHATTAVEDAFILGYLSHLAADTIAHNHFVPYHLARYARSKGLGHLYWEMRADSFISERRWKAVGALKNDRALDRLDELVNATVPRKLLTMRTNKRLFNHVLLVGERDAYRRGVERLHGLSSAPLEKGFLEMFRRAAVERIRLAMRPKNLPLLHHIDTNGKEAQRTAWAGRKRLLRRFRSSKTRARECEEFAKRFLPGMESPPKDGGAPHW